MFPVTIKFIKTHENAKLPKYNHADPYVGDSGLDVAAVEDGVIPAKKWAEVPVGLKLAYITPGFWFRVEGKSGKGYKNHLFPHFGIIDNPYRGGLGVKIYNYSDVDFNYKAGDNIVQFIVYPLIQADCEWTDTAEASARGEKGFGSSDVIQRS